MGRRPALTPSHRSPRNVLKRGHARVMLLLGALSLLASGCTTDFDDVVMGGSDTSQIPGPNPDRLLPANAMEPMGPVAAAQDRLWDIALPIALAIGVLVLAGILFIVVRFRDNGDGELPKQVHGNTTLEIAWTLIPALILVVIAVPTVQTIFDLVDEPDEDAVLVTAIGKQYWWQFEYTSPAEEGLFTGSELHIPVGREVYITLDGTGGAETSQGVLHSFWVPSLAGKRDYVPGAVREMRIQADEPGVYPGLCAEFCGLSHANMRFTVIAHPEDEYQAWVEEQLAPATAPSDGQAVQGAEIFAANCTTCHYINGLNEVVPPPGDLEDYSVARAGPDMTHFASRGAFAGYIFESPFSDKAESDPDLRAEAMQDLRDWINAPQAIKPGAQMQPFPTIQGEDLDALIAYLSTLE